MPQNEDSVSVIKEKLTQFLKECKFNEQSGVTLAGEAWAYRRMLKFIDSMSQASAS